MEQNQSSDAVVPVHIGIIMDGNGRWAKKRNLPRTAGHLAGLTAAKKVVRAAAELGIRYVTLYTFSTENWKRSQQEVGYLMGLIRNHLRAEFNFYKQNRIRIRHIGDLAGLPGDVQTEIVNAVKETAGFTGLTVVLAINYGGRDEIVRGVRRLIARHRSAESITEQDITESLDIPDLPDVDLLIRTGGEMRISNFLLWHASYAELLFTDTLWPDYTATEFIEDIRKFQKRTRRFGGIPNQ